MRNFASFRRSSAVRSDSTTRFVNIPLFLLSSIFAYSSRRGCPQYFVNAGAFLKNNIRPYKDIRLMMSSASSTQLNVTEQNNIPLSSEVVANQFEGAYQLFGKFKITNDQIFYTSPSGLSKGFVNLRPIVPGHVLVISSRVVPRMEMLSDEEYVDLWQSVRVVQKIVEGIYNSKDSNVAVQDGRSAGQSVPHVHVHILPRVTNDFERNDDVYDKLQEWAPTDELRQDISLDVPEDIERKDRSSDEMSREAQMYRDAIP